ncbi:MAG: MFS transporter, partial [Anaerolineales bacterium]|nr:MFS transporter [Anaerolineales bacterium]
HIDLATGGWLMSSIAVAGVVLGLPAALVLARLGPKGAGLAALGATLLGSLIGGLAGSPAALLAGRAVEGIGLGLISVVAPAVISQWFPPAERGLPMGLWASWVPVGNFLIFNLAGPLAGAFGWQGLWWFGAAAAAAAGVLYAVVVGAPAPAGPAPQAGAEGFGRWLWHPASWLVALSFATFTFAFTGYGTWSPTYLMDRLGQTAEAANFNSSLTSLTVIPTTLAAGWALDRVRSRTLVLAIALALSAVLLLWGFRLETFGNAALFFLGIGLVAGFIPTAAFTLAPETMPRPALAGLALGILSIGQNLGSMLGAPALALVIGDGHWEAGTPLIVAALGLGLAATLLLQARLAAGRPRA